MYYNRLFIFEKRYRLPTYDVAEIEPAIFLGYRDITVSKFSLYYLASDTTEAEIYNDKLVLFHENVMFDTDESATKINDKWITQQSNLRLNHDVLDELERWASEDWI